MNTKHFPSSPPTHHTLDAKVVVDDADARSSSLSDIEDGGANERLGLTHFDDASDAVDTEAETERLEDSPQKARKHQNVVLSVSTAGQQNGDTVVSQTVLLTTESNSGKSLPLASTEFKCLILQGMAIDGDTMLQTSDISSLEDSSEDGPASPSRKRKRSAASHSGRTSMETRAQAAGALASRTATPGRERLDTPTIGEEDNEAEGSVESQTNNVDIMQPIFSSTGKEPLPEGKRKAKKIKADQRQASERPVSSIGIFVETVETRDSNGEDAEMEDVVDGAELEITVRNEEGSKCKPERTSRAIRETMGVSVSLTFPQRQRRERPWMHWAPSRSASPTSRKSKQSLQTTIAASMLTGRCIDCMMKESRGAMRNLQC